MNKQENVDNKQKKTSTQEENTCREREGGGEGEDPYMRGTSNCMCVYHQYYLSLWSVNSVHYCLPIPSLS